MALGVAELVCRFRGGLHIAPGTALGIAYGWLTV